MMPINKSRWSKIILVIAIILAVGFLTKGLWWDYFFNYWQEQNAIAEMERPYRTDTYGGKTPEETMSLFLSALSSGGAGEASNYLEPGDKERWLSWFQKKSLAEQGAYKHELIDASRSWKKTVEPDPENPAGGTVYFTYMTYQEKDVVVDLPNGTGGTVSVTMPAGDYENVIVLYFNSYTKVWKISQI